MDRLSGQRGGQGEQGQRGDTGFSAEQVDAVLAGQGKLTLPEALRLRVRYFTDGLVLGRQVFVEEAFCRHRRHFSERRRDGARAMKGAEWGNLSVARALRLRIFGHAGACAAAPA